MNFLTRLLSLALLSGTLVRAEPNLMRALNENVLSPHTAAHAFGENIRGYVFTKGPSTGEVYWTKTLYQGTYREVYGSGKEAKVVVNDYKLQLAARVTGQLRPDLFAALPYTQPFTPNPLFYPGVVPYADGSYPNGASFLKDYRHFSFAPADIEETEKLRVGDKGVALKLKWRKYRLHFVRGPVVFQVAFEVLGPNRDAISTAPYVHPDDRASLLAEIESAHQHAYAAMIEEARATADVFNTWYNRNLPAKFTGPGLKGHYPIGEIRGYPNPVYLPLVQAADAPPDMPVFVTDFTKDTRGGTGALAPALAEFRRKRVLTNADDANTIEAYRITVNAAMDLGDTSNIQEHWETPLKSLDEARRLYAATLTRLDEGARFYRGYFLSSMGSNRSRLTALGLDRDNTIERVSLSLEGADEAAKGLVSWHDTPTYCVVARRGNLIVQVSGRDSMTNALAECERMAELFLRRAAAMKRPPAPADNDPDEVRFYRVALTALPDRVWPDGTTSVRLEAQDESGRPAAGAAFKLSCDTTAMGDLRTDANGTAVLTLKAPGPHSNTISAENRGGRASVVIAKGGMEITTSPPNGNAFGDGLTPLGITVTVRNPRGLPVPGIRVSMTEPGNAAGIRGQLSVAGGAPAADRIDGVTDRDGRLRLQYLAPKLDAAEVKWERARLRFATEGGNDVPQLTGQHDFYVVAGHEFTLTLNKPGFAPNPAPLRLRARNGQVRARFVTAPGGFPIANAEVVVTGPGAKAVGRGTTDAEGIVEIGFATDPVSSSSQSEELKEPVAVPLEAELLDRLQRARLHLDRLRTRGFETAAHDKFWADLPRTLGAAPMAGRSLLQRKGATADYWYNSATRLAFLALFASELNERHIESRAWFLESFKQGIEALGTATALNDTMKEKAKEVLGAGAKTEVWQNWSRTALKKFIDGFMGQMKQALENLPEGVKELPELKDGFAYAERAVKWHEDPSGEAIDAGGEWLSDKLNSSVEDAVSNPWKKYLQALLNDAVTRALTGELPSEDWSAAEGKARDLFVAFEKQHYDLNIATCSEEHYRLWAGLAKDTVGKGAAMYFGTVRQYTKGLTLAQVKSFREGMTPEKLKELVGDPKEFFEKLQESMKGNADLVDRVASVFDTAYLTYRGYNWLSDAYRTHYSLEQIRRGLIGPPKST